MARGIRACLLLCLLLCACGASSPRAARPTVEPTPVPMPIPTEPIEVTRAPEPTETPIPTFTPVPLPTADPNLDPAGVEPATKDDCPESYPVKGNIRDDGRKLYHIKGWPGYAATDPERCFATLTDAGAAGFEPAQ